VTTLGFPRWPCALFAMILTFPVLTDAQTMPDPREIAGVPLPVGDVATGTVTVRVIKGSLANNITGQPVELIVDGTIRREITAATGRAEFSGLRTGARVKAVTIVSGERLESQEFPVPGAGGVRVLLVATDPEAAAAPNQATGRSQTVQGSAQPGDVALGEQSRFVFELGDEAINVFSILQIVNAAQTPVAPRNPVVFESAPSGGTITVLNGSSPRAAAEGRRVVVAGPFPPGPTLVQFGYSVPYSGSSLTIEQRLPVGLKQVTVMAQKVGDMQLRSPQIAQHREMAAQGDTYIVGQGPGVNGGDVLSFSFTGLPHRPLWPRNVALALAGAILAGGAWSSLRRRVPSSMQTNRADLEARRDTLFSELTAIEHQHRVGQTDPAQHAVRRRELIAELESVYAALDH
jgi:hypothetical protein